MMVIKNNLVPFKGFSAMAVFPFVFVRKNWLESIYKRLSLNLASIVYEKTLNHEKIHLHQQAELSILGLALAIGIGLVLGFSWWLLLLPLLSFYVMYGVLYLYELIRVKDSRKAYLNICFEREAYANEGNFKYLSEGRKSLAWLLYFK